MRVLVAPDKFKESATATEVADAVAAACRRLGHTVSILPLADGGEGTLAALGGANKESSVSGPLGAPVTARWRLAGSTAVIEMAEASGLALVGGPGSNDPLDASTTGTGQLIDLAVRRGASTIVVGVGGSATTDGGWGALEALHPTQRLRGVDLLVACDVRTKFLDAAKVFGPQKGATDAQVELLSRRLARLRQLYLETYGVDVAPLRHSGAAGGLAGGLAAVGATLVDGFELVAQELHLLDRIEAVDLVITGEGRVDSTSFDGKVVGELLSMAEEVGVEALVVAGAIDGDVSERMVGASLIEICGPQAAFADVAGSIEATVTELLKRL